MNKYNMLLSALVIFSSNFGFSHGENKSGPHGGFIRMPGAFHTEVVPDGKNKLKVYLLDMEWNKPSVVNSALEVTYKSKQNFKAQCEVKDDYFICSFDPSVNLNKKGKLMVLAQRENQKGAEVLYKLPLKLEDPQEGHSKNH